MSLIVSDNSPLNLLIRVKQTAILPQLYSQVFIPDAVAHEMNHSKTPQAVKKFISTAPSWLTVCTPKIPLAIPTLDAGEVAAISLALELHATLMIDESAGRAVARNRGLQIIGAVGILELAANKGLIDDLRHVHSQIRSMRFFVSHDLLSLSLTRHLAFKRAKPSP